MNRTNAFTFYVNKCVASNLRISLMGFKKKKKKLFWLELHVVNGLQDRIRIIPK